MKRVKAACLCQTLVFSCAEPAPRALVLQQARQDIERYKHTLERGHTPYRIVEETERPDGSVVVKVIRQYNAVPVGDYLD